jgi:hypothetical protein
LTQATTKQRNPCQVRRNTEYPCPNQAVVEICGIPFCAACARRQEAYFAIGELTQEAHGLRYGPLVGALESMRRGRKTGGIALAEELEAISNN